MVFNKVDIGQEPGDGSGDTLRDAFEKINANFDDLASALLTRLAQHPAFAPLRHSHADTVHRYLEDGPPKRAPTTYGALWVDASTNRIYLATGTSSPADWREIAFVKKGDPA